MTAASNRRVSYFYRPEGGDFHFGKQHFMKPHRVTVTHDLVMNYGLYKKMKVYKAYVANAHDLANFHDPEYIEFLRTVTPADICYNQSGKTKYLSLLTQGEDCPIFDGVYDYCCMYAGATLEAAQKLNYKGADICINWAGGLHHAKKGSASGFCYINDIVLGILELLKYFPRILYIDIDVHHGDGVQEAFYNCDRVMTLSFHGYGRTKPGGKIGDMFFPGTGDMHEQGVGLGRYFSVNIPLKPGITDIKYMELFKPIVQAAMDHYRPNSIVLQCGADSLAGDRLGIFSLTTRGHGECVEFVKSLNVPTLILGGGGYTLRNVARCWTYETSLLVNETLPNELPPTPYSHLFKSDPYLYPNKRQFKYISNLNTKAYLQRICESSIEYIKIVESSPSVQLLKIPDGFDFEEARRIDAELTEDPDARVGQFEMEQLVPLPSEFYDDDRDQDVDPLAP